MVGDEDRESVWHCILRMHDPNEEGLADVAWFDMEELESYFGDDRERYMAEFQTLLKLGVVIMDKHGQYIINLWWDQGPGVFVEPEKPKPRYLNSN